MLLSTYLTRTQNLLLNPSAPTDLYATASLVSYINQARSQVAGDGECVRSYASLAALTNTQSYNFSSIFTGSSVTTGIQGTLAVRMITAPVTGGRAMLAAWPWEWFNTYYIAALNIATARPQNWAQFGQGVNGTLFLSPTPNSTYSLQLDAVCYPIDLVSDATVDAIPYPWTDAVPYYAAYLAYLSSQVPSRQNDATRMFNLYEEFKQRARRLTTPTVLPYQYHQSGTSVPPIPAGVTIPTPSGGGG